MQQACLKVGGKYRPIDKFYFIDLPEEYAEDVLDRLKRFKDKGHKSKSRKSKIPRGKIKK